MFEEFWSSLLASPSDLSEVTANPPYQRLLTLLAGRGLIVNEPEAHRVIMDFLHRLFTETANDLSQFAEYDQKKQYYVFEDYLEVTQRFIEYQLPLIIDLINGVKLVRFESDIQGLTIKENDAANFSSISLGSNTTLENRKSELTLVKKQPFGTEKESDVQEEFTQINTVMKLFWGKGVGLGGTIVRRPLGEKTRARLLPTLSSDFDTARKVDSASLVAFSKFWSDIGKNGWKTLDIALRRFDDTRRNSIDDRIIDLIVALESLISEQGQTEISYKLSVRTATLVQTLFKIPARNAYLTVSSGYKFRSQIMHGNRATEKSEELSNIETSLQGIIRCIMAIFLKSDLNQTDRGRLLKELDDIMLDLMSNDGEPSYDKYPVTSRLLQCSNAYPQVASQGNLMQ